MSHDERRRDEPRRDDEDTSIPMGKRSGRDGVRPESQPGEFADDMRTNRFEPPPPPKEKR